MEQPYVATDSESVNYGSANSYFDLAQLGRVAWRRKFLLIIAVAAGLAAGALYARHCQPLYKAEAQVLVVKKHPDAVTGENRQTSQLDDYLASQRAIIQSHMIVQRAVAQSKLDELSSFGRVKGDLAEAILKKLSVERLKDKDSPGNINNILTISFVGTGEEDCATVVNAVLDSYKSFLNETYRNISTDTIHTIAEARTMLENDLAKQEAAYRKFRQESRMVWKGKEEINPHQERVTQLESKRSALLLRQAEVEGQIKSLESARQSGASPEELERLVTLVSSKEDSVPHDRNAPSLKSQLAPLLHEESMLLEYFGPKHPQVVSVRERIEATRRLFATGSTSSGSSQDGPQGVSARNLSETYLEHLRREHEHLKTAEQVLAALSEREQKAARELNGFEIEDTGFRNSIARTQQLYDGVVKRLQEASLVKDYGGFEARVIDPADSAKKVFPNLVLVLAGAAFLGLMFGGGLAGAAELRAWRTRENRQRAAHIPDRMQDLSERYAVLHSHHVMD